MDNSIFLDQTKFKMALYVNMNSLSVETRSAVRLNEAD